MKAELVETGHLESQLTIVIEKEDYQEEFNKKLKDYQGKTHMKGFRKGKTPLSALKKMYGKSVLTDVINDTLQKSLNDYIADNKLDILGSPLASLKQEQVNIDVKSGADYTFIFDLGMAPEFTLEGASDSDSYEDYQVIIEDSIMDEEMENLLKRFGKQEEVDEPVEDTDILTLEINETGDVTDREPYSAEITVMPERMTEDYSKAVMGQKIGFDFDVDIYELEKDAKEDYVQKYFLKDAPEDVNKTFKATISGIKRLTPAEYNEEFFTTAFGKDNGVDSEESARAFTRTKIEEFYATQSKNITQHKIMNNLVEGNEISLPDTFLRRLLLETDENLKEEELDEKYEAFAKTLKWTLIKNKISNDNDIKVDNDEIRAAIKARTIQQFAQFGQVPGVDYDDITNRMMQNSETVQRQFDELLTQKVLDNVYDKITKIEKKVTQDEYKDIVKELQENNK